MLNKVSKYYLYRIYIRRQGAYLCRYIFDDTVSGKLCGIFTDKEAFNILQKYDTLNNPLKCEQLTDNAIQSIIYSLQFERKQLIKSKEHLIKRQIKLLRKNMIQSVTIGLLLAVILSLLFIRHCFIYSLYSGVSLRTFAFALNSSLCLYILKYSR